jgi:cytochrome c oxidase assembly protein subunit 15
MHRLGALVVIVVVGMFVWRLNRISSGKKVGKMLGGMLLLQVLLGLSNVWFSLPIAVAVGHNAVAALLMALMVIALYRMNKK